MILFISSLEIVVVLREAKSEGWPDQSTFLWLAASLAYAAAINPYGIKTPSVNGLSTFPIKGYPTFW